METAAGKFSGTTTDLDPRTEVFHQRRCSLWRSIEDMDLRPSILEPGNDRPSHASRPEDRHPTTSEIGFGTTREFESSGKRGNCCRDVGIQTTKRLHPSLSVAFDHQSVRGSSPLGHRIDGGPELPCETKEILLVRQSHAATTEVESWMVDELADRRLEGLPTGGDRKREIDRINVRCFETGVVETWPQ